MNSLRLFSGLFLVLLCSSFSTQALSGLEKSEQVAYLDPSLSLDDRVNDLISRMTLDEKISQMSSDAVEIARLGIPEYCWWNECLHGVGRAGKATVFPQAIGLAATWDKALIFDIATAISDEARAKHHLAQRAGSRKIYQGLTFWSPNVNIFRDPRWGRGQETYGEDPFLTAQLAIPFIRGLQGDDDRYLKVVATAKHYAVHNGPEPSRHSFDTDVSERDLYETYFPAFKACVIDANVESVMCAYNRFRGEPCCGSPSLLNKILREEWGFQGHVVSDCGAIRDFHLKTHHGVTETESEATTLAVRSGTDLNCGRTYENSMKTAVELGQLSEFDIDVSLKRLFRARFLLGMFDPQDQVPYASIDENVIACAEHRELSLQAAEESIVLLKNDNALPWDPDSGESIAVIGPNSEYLQSLYGNYHGTAVSLNTPLNAIKDRVGKDTTVYFAQGCEFADGIPLMKTIDSQYLLPLERDGDQHGLKGAYYDLNGENEIQVFERVDPTVDFSWKDQTPVSGKRDDSFKIVWKGYLRPDISGEYVIGVKVCNSAILTLEGEEIVRVNGRHRAQSRSKAVVLEAGRMYRVELEMESYGSDPQVKLLWRKPDPQWKEQALEVARKADRIVLCMGLNPDVEGEEMKVSAKGFQGGDRTQLELPAVQLELMKAIHALGKPIVLVTSSGSALALNWEHQNLPAILHNWYPGEHGGKALAKILFGDASPSGKLPVTFYKSTEDLPPFEDYRMKGRTYRYFEGEALYPFGYGLTYGTFEYELKGSDSITIQGDEEVSLGLNVSNIGDFVAKEVVQLYVRKMAANSEEPLRSLKAFQKIELNPNEQKSLSFEISRDLLALADEKGEFNTAPGEYEIWLGSGQPLQIPHLPATAFSGKRVRIVVE